MSDKEGRKRLRGEINTSKNGPKDYYQGSLENQQSKKERE